MNKKLILNHTEQKKSQGYTNKKFDTFFDGKVLQICFYSVGCKFSKSGCCIMCDYGKPRRKNLTSNDIRGIIHSVFSELNSMPKVLLLNSLGSVLDYHEMPYENIITLIEEVSKLSVKTVIFETHYTSITEDILKIIKEKLEGKQVSIELGLESYNEEYRKEYLNKIIDNETFIKKVRLIKSYGFSVEANVIFGMPYISTKDQIKDTNDSIKWCFKNNIDEVNLFPMNIKPYTLLYKLYETGKYFQINHKDFITVLKNIPINYIDKVYLCWYGNREIRYKGKRAILPFCDIKDIDKIMTFYKDFNSCKDRDYRKKLLDDINL